MTNETVEYQKARLKKRVFSYGLPGMFVITTLIVAATYFGNGDPVYARMSGIEKLIGAGLLTFMWGLLPLALLCWVIYWALSLDIKSDPKPVFERRQHEAGIASADHLKGLGISDER